MTVQRITIHKPGGWSALTYQSFELPPMKANEVRVRTQAISINFADIAVRMGLYESAKKLVGFPITPGFDFAGIVDSIGSDVSKFKVGDRVFGVTFFGAYSTHITVSEDQLFHLPETWSWQQAAAFPTVHLTAWYALHIMGAGKKGQLALIHSAAGGVGLALLQLCKRIGITTIAVVRGHHKVEFAEKAGADYVIDKAVDPLWTCFDQIAADGCDLIFDANGYDTVKAGYQRLKPEGRLICFGAATMLKRGGGRIPWFRLAWRYLTRPTFDPLAMTSENRSILAFNLSFLFHRIDLLRDAFKELLDPHHPLLEPPYTTFSFEQVVQAHQHIESGKSVGKILLMIDHELEA